MSKVLTSVNDKKSLANASEVSGFVVQEGGVLSLVQDAGRFGAFSLGLTNGGPADSLAFYWANRLCGNRLNTTAIEVNLGGFTITAQSDNIIAVTGAPMPLTVNGKPKKLWRSYQIKAGDTISLGYAAAGVRCYLAVLGGFNIAQSFASTATVCRESIGGLNGGKLVSGDILPCKTEKINIERQPLLMLPVHEQPQYNSEVVLHTVLGYQQEHFSRLDKKLFFSSEYQVSKHWDRMGYRLQGRAIKANVDGIVSEGICYGAVQFPGDGQPIVLLNDRQTIGGYPKIGSVISQDCAKLAQLREGGSVRFEPISISQADNIFHLNVSRFKKLTLVNCR